MSLDDGEQRDLLWYGGRGRRDTDECCRSASLTFEHLSTAPDPRPSHIVLSDGLRTDGIHDTL